MRINQNRLGKQLWTAQNQGHPLTVYRARDDSEEAEWIVRQINLLKTEGMLSLQNIAVLYRTNAQSRILEHILFSQRLPYRVHGGFRFFERKEVKDALAYLRLVNNPQDDASFLRVVNFPIRGIGSRSLEELQDLAQAQGMNLWQATLAIIEKNGGTERKGFSAFVALIHDLQNQASMMDLPSLIGTINQQSGLLAHYQKEHDGGQERLENLGELINAGLAFQTEKLGNYHNRERNANLLNEFLTHASLEAGEHQAESGQEAVQLMTVHAAKGLEFDAVFMSGLEEGLFPSEQSLDEVNNLQEERRLMYVAITRARQRLYLSHAESRLLHGRVSYQVSSRFVQEIPAELCQFINSPPRHRTSPYTAKNNSSNLEHSAVKVSDVPWRIGQTVTHDKFGSGTVLGYEDGGSRIRVNFRQQGGIKLLDVTLAKLR